MVFLLRSLGRLPLTTLYGFSWFVYFVTFHLLRWRRELAARNIARSFPEKTPESALSSCSSRIAT